MPISVPPLLVITPFLCVYIFWNVRFLKKKKKFKISFLCGKISVFKKELVKKKKGVKTWEDALETGKPFIY